MVNRRQVASLSVLLAALLAPPAGLLSQALSSAEPTAAQILADMDAAMNFSEGTMILTFEDVKASGAGRRLEARVLYALEEGTLVEFLSPEREKGKRVLMIGDSMWMGTPSVSRPIRLSGKDSFMGTSFTNDDVMNLDKSDDYEARVVSADADGWTLELVARTKKVPYPRMIVVVDRRRLPVSMVMYALSNREAKRIEYGEVRAFEGKLRPATMTVIDAMAAGNRTVVRFESVSAGRVDRARLSPASFMN